MSRRRSRLCAALPAPPPAPHSPILFKSSQSFVDPRPMRIAPRSTRTADGRVEDIGRRRRRDLQKHTPLQKKGRQEKPLHLLAICSRPQPIVLNTWQIIHWLSRGFDKAS